MEWLPAAAALAQIPCTAKLTPAENGHITAHISRRTSDRQANSNRRRRHGEYCHPSHFRRGAWSRSTAKY